MWFVVALLFIHSASQVGWNETVANSLQMSSSSVDDHFVEFLQTLGWSVDVKNHPGWTGFAHAAPAHRAKRCSMDDMTQNGNSNSNSTPCQSITFNDNSFHLISISICPLDLAPCSERERCRWNRRLLHRTRWEHLQWRLASPLLGWWIFRNCLRRTHPIDRRRGNTANP